MLTISAGDYTVYFDLEPSFYEKFLQKEKERWTVDPRCKVRINELGLMPTDQELFRDWLTYNMEDKISQLQAKTSQAKTKGKKSKIAITKLCFN